jgi:adenine-specific DNA-methyltransferase
LETISEATAATDPAAPPFEQTILDNLANADIQNGRRHERIEFASVDSYPDRTVL